MFAVPERCHTGGRSWRDAGAQFVVAPGFNPRVVDYCLEHDIPVYPGIATPTEIEAALEKGLTTLKFFPAEPMGGLAFLKAIAAPFVDVSFMPTGGINAANIASYLAFKRVVACGGSWMAPVDWIAANSLRDSRERSGVRRRSRRTGGDGMTCVVTLGEVMLRLKSGFRAAVSIAHARNNLRWRGGECRCIPAQFGVDARLSSDSGEQCR